MESQPILVDRGQIEMTLDEANKQRLDVAFCATSDLADSYKKALEAAGRKVVAVFEETLPGATKSLHIVAFARMGKTNAPR